MNPQDAFLARLAQIADRVDSRLDATLPVGSTGRIAEAMRYACLGGGKRLRAFLVCESGALFGVDSTQAETVAAAIEALHTYSLIHDDLPAMDDDDLRRGKPTLHIRWDEATAILTGDALQAFAFELLARPETHPDAEVRCRLIAGMAAAAGAEGMVLGQDLDLAAETAPAPFTLEEITRMQNLKTGALIEFSATAGALLAHQPSGSLAAYARALGLAFQIHDDILDVTGEAGELGKRVGKDQGAGKATFVSLLGLDGARSRARELAESACDALSEYGSRAEPLRQAAYFSISRSN